MNTETIKAAFQAELTAIYQPGARYCLSKYNGLSARTKKTLRAGGMEWQAAHVLVCTWGLETRKALNVDLRNKGPYVEQC
jgi:hypothetical protein